VEIKAGSRFVAHVKWQFLQFFGKCRSPTVKYPCMHNKLMIRMTNTWSMLNSFFHAFQCAEKKNEYIGGKILPTVEFGCLDAILVNTSFQLGLAKCVLTWNMNTINMFKSNHDHQHSRDYHSANSWYSVYWTKVCLPLCLTLCLHHAWRGSGPAPSTAGSSLHLAPHTRSSDSCAAQWHPG